MTKISNFRMVFYSIAGILAAILIHFSLLSYKPKESYLDNFPVFSISHLKSYANPSAFLLEVTVEFEDNSTKTKEEYQAAQLKEAFFLKYFMSLAESKGVTFDLDETNITETNGPQKDMMKLSLSSEQRSKVLDIFNLIESLDNYNKKNNK